MSVLMNKISGGEMQARHHPMFLMSYNKIGYALMLISMKVCAGKIFSKKDMSCVFQIKK